MSERPRGEVLRLVVAWLVVLLPAGWGVGQVIRRALALFR